MSFKVKVLLTNIILMAVTLGVIGYLLLRNSFSVSMDMQVESGMDENQMIVASVQAEIVNLLVNDSFENMEQLASVGESIGETMEGTGASFCLLSGQQSIIYSNSDSFEYSPQILDYLEKGTGNYLIEDRDSGQILTIASMIQVRDSTLYVLNQKDISDIYIENERQIRYFRILMLVALVLCCAVILLMTTWLTKPIEQLNQTASVIASGDYSVRTEVHSNDEIGELADKFDRMADAVEKHVKDLKDQARQQEDFVASFTHEIKTPMTAIIGYSDMLRSKEMEEEQRFLTANYIFHEGKRLEGISLKLFDLIALDRKEIDKTLIYTSAFQNEIEEMAVPILSRNQMNLSCDMEPAALYGDRDLLSTVLINLIDNARKASEEGSSLEIVGRILDQDELQKVKDTHKDASALYYEIRVIDHGCGIPKEEVDKICEAFYMVDKSRARKQGGAGIGLATTRKIIEAHHGYFLIESVLHQGTTMIILLPMADHILSETKTAEQEEMP
ncbi:MAG: HAMP domain-containing histidine kinase [Lachnospiraceae bacterium]|nr:HAMP domain-containing histidine kinase [Lachnospiraceae bacterium]